MYDFDRPVTSNIVEHVETLQRYAEQCRRVVEFGTETGYGSTRAFLLAKPEILICYDVSPMPQGLDVAAEELGISFQFQQQDTLEVVIPECDLLFIDSKHTYEQLKAELEIHGDKAGKWLIFHDTETFGANGEDGSTPGLMRAIDEFLEENLQWKVKEVFNNNNGLLVLERV